MALVEWCRESIRQVSVPRLSLDVHQAACRAIAEYAPGCECTARREYPVPLGFIDVVWFYDGRLVVAFEVDHGVKEKSLEKLLSQRQCTRCLVSLRDGYLKWPIPNGVHHLVLGVLPWVSMPDAWETGFRAPKGQISILSSPETAQSQSVSERPER
jgi:hypothetical protein